MVRGEEQGNTREIQFRGTFDHVTLLLVVSAPGKIMNMFVILSGVEARYRKQLSDKYETAYDYLPKPNNLHMRPISGV